MLRPNASSRELAKMEELASRGQSSGYGYNTGYSKGRGFFGIPRRTVKIIRRYAGFLALVVLFLLLWQELDPHDGATSLQRYSFRARRRAAELRARRAAGSRLHLAWPGWDGISNIFAFGDSYTETGFDPDGYQPDRSNPLGNPKWPGRTANFGPNYLSYLTGIYNESFIGTYNFARGGLAGQKRILDDGNGDRIPVRNQIDDVFLPRYGRSAGGGRLAAGSGWRQDDSLFVLFDYADELVQQYMLRNGEPRNLTKVLVDMIDYEDNLNKLYSYGARNFLIINVPALEESFTLRNAPQKKAMTQFGAEGVDVNGRLAFLVQHFSLTHPDATVFFYDLHRVSIRTRGDPQNYPETSGIRRKEGYCYFYADHKEVVEDDDACGNKLVEFYWKDETHHTEPFHRLVARHAVELMKDLDRAMPLLVP